MRTNTQIAPALTYPTPAMQCLIQGIRTDIRFLRQWYGAPPDRDRTGVIRGVTPVTVLDTLEAVVESVEPALRFFLNYPTQRLSVFLTNFVAEADRFVSWLSMHRGASQDPSLITEMYEQSCERLQASLRDWHNAIVIAGIYEFDVDTPEVRH